MRVLPLQIKLWEGEEKFNETTTNFFTLLLVNFADIHVRHIFVKYCVFYAPRVDPR